jgi:hypothetical protein
MRALVLTCSVLVAGCADRDAELASQAETARTRSLALAAMVREPPEGPSRELVFRLAFDRENDLDLYVTDPLEETVYFANHRVKTGGEIIRDVRCATDADVPGVEEVRFAAPYPGRYRVGVDFAERCQGDGMVAGYAVSVQGAGEQHVASGILELNQFEVVTLEFDLEGDLEGKR